MKAIPHPSLGLAMPVTEFVVAVRIWLGIVKSITKLSIPSVTDGDRA